MLAASHRVGGAGSVCPSGKLPSLCALCANDGVITLEATIALVIMLPMLAAIMFFFPFFRVQQLTAHALLEAIESLSLDSYGADQINDGYEYGPYEIKIDNLANSKEALKEAAIADFSSWEWDASTKGKDAERAERSYFFSRLDQWYIQVNSIKKNGTYYKRNSPKTNPGVKSASSSLVYESNDEYQDRITKEVILPRFFLYLGGSKEGANDLLERMYVVPGSDGSYTSGVRIDAATSSVNYMQDKGGGMYEVQMTIKYKVQYPLLTILNNSPSWEIKQSVRTYLWARPMRN